MQPHAPVTHQFRPVAALGTVAGALFAGATVLTAPLFISSWADYARLSSYVGGSVGHDAYLAAELGKFDWLFAALGVAMLAFLAASATLLTWVWRARTNAALLAPQTQFRFSPAFAVGGLLVPFANLWWSRAILQEIWTASRPADADAGARSTVQTWWLCLISGTVVSIVAQVLIPTPVITYSTGGGIVSGGDEAMAAFLATALVNTVLAALTIAHAALLISLVRQISRWQTERFAAAPSA